MASEIRVNKINNRAGLGTVTYTDTGIIVSGIVTANSFKGDGSSLTGLPAGITINNNGTSKIITGSGNPNTLNANVHLTFDGTTLDVKSGTGIVNAGQLNVGNNIKLGNAGVITATSFVGDGSSLSNLPAGAPVGGASTNTVFFENDTAVAVNYQVTSGKNAMSAGPIAINAGIAVTVPSGSSWTIV
jgi:hypothetical protein